MRASSSETLIKPSFSLWTASSATHPREDRENTNDRIYVFIYINCHKARFYSSEGENAAVASGGSNETLMDIKVNCSSPRDFWWLIDLAYRTGWHGVSLWRREGSSFVPLQTQHTVISRWTKVPSRQMSWENGDFLSFGVGWHSALYGQAAGAN